MTRATIILTGPPQREKAARWVAKLPDFTRIDFKDPKRTLPQNDRFWAMLTDIATQFEHAGRKYTPDEWKILMLHAWGREVRFVPSLDGKTFVPFAQSSSDLSKEEMSEVIEFMFAWGSEHNVTFHDPDLARRESLGEAA